MHERERCGGVLAHPTSLWGPHGVGALGPEAHAFVDRMRAAGLRRWQVLPLGPAGHGHSPYAALSVFAGSPWLVSLAPLFEAGWLAPGDLDAEPDWPEGRVDFAQVEAWKGRALRAAHERFAREASDADRGALAAFCHDARDWLDDYALFMSLKQEAGGAAWTDWHRPLARREPEALAAARARLAGEVDLHRFVQFVFERQWQALRAHAHRTGVRLIGDLPLFAAHDSADVWAHPELFHLDEEGQARVVAGVPPDYFSATGQLWGNPVYRWSAHRATGYAWWLARLARALGQVDFVRLDHFRGLCAAWHVRATEPTAQHGRWVRGPGAAFLRAVRERFGSLPLIAEDLGTITEDVYALRDRFDLPGMRVLQFAFGDEDPKTALHAPHNHVRNAVAYTGTHDNDTAASWLLGLDREHDPRTEEERGRERARVLAYAGAHTDDPAHWVLLRLLFGSVADIAVAPVQDLLGLGPEARMNRPGTVGPQNWSWRLTDRDAARLCSDEVTAPLREAVGRYGRA